ncbi:MAG: cryptochrome/photolyase family protein [Nocardioides sp.]
MTSVMWFRRDLRLGDHPALAAACAEAQPTGGVFALFVIDPALWKHAGEPRRAYLSASLRDLDTQLGGRLVVRTGHPVEVVPAVAREVAASAVHISADYAPYGVRRDREVGRALGGVGADGVRLVATGSPYAVAPGRVLTGGGQRFKVFTPYFRAWERHGWRQPIGRPEPEEHWLELPGEALPDPHPDIALPAVGEAAALDRWHAFRPRLERYAEDRDKPATGGTSGLSAALRWGEVHPRTLLADLGDGAADRTFRSELAWREFHADVLAANPRATGWPLRPEYDEMRTDEPGEKFDAWRRGRTGFPIVDAGMRELLATGLMHNRVRMIVASFLIKDLHVDWRHGARHFMAHLIDGDVASNQLNWQWVAGSGTDAAPYFRVFNPTSQGRTFDPAASYIKRWVPELAHAADPHEPGLLADYPAPIVDHAAERIEALERWRAIRP